MPSTTAKIKETSEADLPSVADKIFNEPAKESKLSVREDTKAITTETPAGHMEVEGLQDVPISMIPIPLVKMVHPTTKDSTDKDGNDTPVGYFLNTQTKKSYQNLEFFILRARPVKLNFKDPKTNEPVVKDAFAILGVMADDGELFIMNASGSSFWNFRSLLGVVKGAKLPHVWANKVIATAENRESDYGKYKAATFTLGDKATEVQELKLTSLYKQYGAALDRAEEAHEEGAEEVKEDDIPF